MRHPLRAVCRSQAPLNAVRCLPGKTVQSPFHFRPPPVPHARIKQVHGAGPNAVPVKSALRMPMMFPFCPAKPKNLAAQLGEGVATRIPIRAGLQIGSHRKGKANFARPHWLTWFHVERLPSILPPRRKCDDGLAGNCGVWEVPRETEAPSGRLRVHGSGARSQKPGARSQGPRDQ